MNAARIKVASTLIEEFLCLPQHNSITGIMWDAVDRVLWLRVDGPDMPSYEPGQRVPEIQPTYRNIAHELVSLGKEQSP